MAEKTLSPRVIAQRAAREAREEAKRRFEAQPGRARKPANFSPEVREASRQRMIEYNRKVKLGLVDPGNKSSGRPKIKSETQLLNEHLAEAAKERSGEVLDLIDSIIRNRKARASDRMGAAKMLLDAEREVGKQRSRDIDDLTKLGKHEMAKRLAGKLLERGTIDRVRQFIDAEYEELDGEEDAPPLLPEST